MTRASRTRTRAPRTARSRAFVAIAVVAVLTVLAGAISPWAYSSIVDTTAKDRIEAAPPPPLFPDADIAPIGQKIAQQQPTAEHLMAGWWSQHDATADDAGFVSWLEANLPGPPTSAVRAQEIKQVQRIAPTRTTAGIAAATWLEAYGKKDVWKLAAHDQAELMPVSSGDAAKNDVDAMLSMSKTVADTLGAKYQQSAPYVMDPSLRTDHVVAPGDVCPCSYPSRHATSGAASATYLAGLAPYRAGEYRWWQDEIAWSRVYMAGHVSSDITGGTLLGDMIGEYFLVTRGHQPVPAT
ncbi:phosphatase PAP2 family protein [Nocardioides sp. KIGAM211]|uniref:Phosphatase PAP2 family protein n=1 Tax=Nocardioides luti TaxID=2761101 RepID=A0A7X0RM84_9ACTN|nr:phosphatase PAP2 family protein [Nocardioides luti]MBB6629765.1 phosphatase PAP2 family protein [Nocardioides luti]